MVIVRLNPRLLQENLEAIEMNVVVLIALLLPGGHLCLRHLFLDQTHCLCEVVSLRMVCRVMRLSVMCDRRM